MGIRMLLNECETINRDDQRIYIAGIDDALPCGQHRKSWFRDTEQRVLDPTFTYAGNLSAGSPDADFSLLLKAGTPMEVKFASLEASRSPLILFSPGTWARARALR